MATDTQALISPSLEDVLIAGREDYNRRYARARQQFRQLDADAFGEFLLTLLDPLVRQQQSTASESSELISAAYDAGLVLLGQDLLRADHRGNVLRGLWLEVLPRLGPALLAEPQRVIASLCNASIQISGHSGARSSEWLHGLARLGPLCDSADCLLRLAQILAWRAGLAHYRMAALDLLAGLPSSLAAQALELPEDMAPDIAIEHLRNNPWWQVHDAADSLREVARVGAFTGYGGLFPEPPRVQALDQNLYVSSGLRTWLLCADIHGWSLHPALPEECSRLAREPERCQANLSGKRVKWRGQGCNIDDVRSLSSAAETRHTLAVCSPDTHAVILLAGAPG